MKASLIRKYGKPNVLYIDDVSEPTPKSNQVKVKVVASSVNPVDWKVRSGALAFLTGFKFPKILGGDFAGIVIECGADVVDIKKGDRVFGLSNAMSIAGAYAEYIVCDAHKLSLAPIVSLSQSACIPLAGSTAYQALYKIGGLKPGMRVLITGATGGVGHFAVQIAKAANCYVSGVCHSQNADLAIKLGCDEVLPYDKIHIKKSDKTFDVIVDAAAKYGYVTCRSLLSPNGVFISTIPSPFLLFIHLMSDLFLAKKGRFVGVSSNTATLNELAYLCNQGKLNPWIENEFSLDRMPEAHALSETEKVRGKILIHVQNEI
jgi:NADPH:quinone reductase-like Zn-dependent oxidoreductase